MEGFRIPVGDWASAALDWILENLAFLLDAIDTGVKASVGGVTDALLTLPAVALIIVFALIGWGIRSWQFAIGTAVTMMLIVGMDQWVAAIQTLSLVLVATIIAIIIAVPLGIWAARNKTVSNILRPVLDFMQTMPAFVYLIPTVLSFSIGVVPGVVSTIIFALPPGVRLTELGIRGVDSERVEAGHAFGATPGQILRGIQLPLAAPTIMTGINQVIMLALSMAVVAGIAGADGLGKEVITAISTLNVGRGTEAGLSVVILAVYLDRLTSALGARADYKSSLLAVLGRGRAQAAQASAGIPS